MPRLIPSSYRQIALGSNRNFGVRREFAVALDAAPIQVTSVLNGAFADMLTGTAPMIAFGRRKVMYWSSADQILDFTTKDDVARIVALVALDADAPRVVEIAGDRVTARSVAQTMPEVTGTKFTLQFAGTTGTLSLLAKAVRRFSKTTDAAFPAWQGMQYFVSMFSGQAQFAPRRQRPVRRAQLDDRARRARRAPCQSGPSMTDGDEHGGYVPAAVG